MPAENVSVLMCTYNGAAYLREQLDTILDQTWPLYELLVFDDASTDDTWEVLKEYAAKYPVMRIFRNEKNMGYAANFKQAFLAAKGDVIAIADQDDIWVKDKIEKMLENWDSKSLLIYCDSLRFTDKLPLNPTSKRNYRRFEGKDGRKIFLFNTVSGHAIIIRKELLRLAFPFPDNIFYDWWFAVVAAYNGGVKYIKQVLVFQRVHSQNVSIDDGADHAKKEQRNAYKIMVIKHLEQFKNVQNIPDKDKKFAERFAKFLKRSIESKLYFPLLVFMIRHSKTLFHKRKLISYVKYAFRLTFNYQR